MDFPSNFMIVQAPSTALGISARDSKAAQTPQLRLRDCFAGGRSAQE